MSKKRENMKSEIGNSEAKALKMSACAKPPRGACAEKEGVGKMDKQLQENMPIYMQIMQKVREAIASGELAPGARVASVRELAGAFAVNPNTMQRALNELEREGLLVSERTSGRFVTKDSAQIDAMRRQLAEEAAARFRREMQTLGFSEAEMLAFFRVSADDAVRGA